MKKQEEIKQAPQRKPYVKPTVESEDSLEKQILTTGCNADAGPPFCWSTPHA